jgi:SPP1 gp7 family putative phage head morphogenesis protein
MNKRFTIITKAIKAAVIEQDCFGLDNPISVNEVMLPGREAFKFDRNANKVAQFMKWLGIQVQNEILDVSDYTQVGTSIESAWTNKYIADSYKRGLQRARIEVKRAGFKIPNIEQTGGIDVLFNQPATLDRVGALYTRTFTKLREITTAMDAQISTILSQGLIDGDGPQVLANKLVKTITGPMGDLSLTDTLGRFIPAKRRAQMLARTETIRAHHLGTIQEYESYAVEGVMLNAELSTAGDNRVCDQCSSLEGNIYTLEEARNIIPVHPNCRCIMLPVKIN